MRILRPASNFYDQSSINERCEARSGRARRKLDLLCDLRVESPTSELAAIAQGWHRSGRLLLVYCGYGRERHSKMCPDLFK